MRSFLREFKDFISAGNLVELAVAFILGLAIKAVVDAFIQGVANPIVGAVFGKPNLDDVLRFTLRDREGTEDDSVIAIGVVLTQLVSLITVGVVLFLIVKAYNRMRRTRPESVGPSEIELLTEIRDALRARS